MSKCPQAKSLNFDFYPEDKSGQKMRPCLACKETRAARDACLKDQVTWNTQSHMVSNQFQCLYVPVPFQNKETCINFIKAHNECMRKMGFKTPKYSDEW